MKKNGQRRYKCFVLGRDKSYFVKNHPDSTKKLSETDTINMLEVLTDNIFGGRIFEQTVGILICTTMFFFSPTCSFTRTRQASYRGFSRKNEKILARSFNFTLRYIDDILSLDNSKLGDCVDHIYPH